MESKKSYSLMRYREYAEFQFAIDGEGLDLRQSRQALKDQGILCRELVDLDMLVMETVQTADYINPVLLADSHTEPLNHWWWHLGKLRAGTYPAHLLPSALRAIYQPLAQITA